MRMIPNALEENAAAEQADLEGGDVDVSFVFMPCVGADAVGYKGGEEAVGIEQEEDREDGAHENLNEEDPVHAALSRERLDDQAARHGVALMF